MTGQLDRRDAKEEGLELKVRLLADEAGQVGKIQRRVDARALELASTKKALGAKEVVLEEKVCKYGGLELELSAARTAVWWGRRSHA